MPIAEPHGRILHRPMSTVASLSSEIVASSLVNYDEMLLVDAGDS